MYPTKCKRHCCQNLVSVTEQTRGDKVYCSRLCKQKDANERHKKKYPERAKERQKKFDASRKHRRRSYHFKQKYGITVPQWLAIIEAQNGRCAACKSLPVEGDKNWWHIDHDHKTGFVRGILCRTCNLSLGSAKDTIRILRGLIRYLEKTKNVDLRAEYGHIKGHEWK